MKKGITLSVVMIAIVIMLIIISSASVIGKNAISTANFEKYRSNISRVYDMVNHYYINNGTLPTTLEVIVPSSLNENFKKVLSDNNDLEDELFIVDISKLNDPSIENGIGDIYDQDVFLVSKKSQNIYYLKGYKYKSVVYYTK